MSFLTFQSERKIDVPYGLFSARIFLNIVNLVNFIIPNYSQSDTICSFVEPSLTTYSIESADFGNDEIHFVSEFYHSEL